MVKKTNIAKIKNTNIPTAVTPGNLLAMAIEKGAGLEQVREFMDLQKEWEANEARKAYHLAISDFKCETINLIKNKKVSFTNNKNQVVEYSHATLDHIVDTVAPLLAKHGLNHKWIPVQGDGGRITVTCTITHANGHSESVSLSGSPDDTGNKNNLQRISSTVAYLERYTFLAITGLAAKGQDDDGIASGKRTGYSDGLEEGLSYGMAIYKHKEVIEMVKEYLAVNDLEAAAEYLYSLNNKELMSINRAPTKGGIFTVEEKAKMNGDRSPEWRAARKIGIELNPNVSRGI